MTTNQIAALAMPLVTAAAVFVTALFIRKPWAETSAKNTAEVDVEAVDDALAQAESLIRTARQRLRSLKSPVT
jgi:hypothetical protein